MTRALPSTYFRYMSTAAAAGSAAPASPFLTLDESKEKLPAVLARSPKVLAYFTAAWCGPCKAIAPHFAALAKEHGSAIQFVKVDIDDNADATEMVSWPGLPSRPHSV